MKIKREQVTPYLTVIFGVVGCSGLLMFFHVLDNYTNVVHELLGVVFFLFVFLHVFNNRKSIRNYQQKRKFLNPIVVIAAISALLVVYGKLYGNTKELVLNKLISVPAYKSFTIMQANYEQGKILLQKNGIMVQDSLESVEMICTRNHKSPEEIMDLLLE